MLTVLVTGLAMGALYAAAALAYNVMYSTSKVLSITTGHLCMLGGVFGAWFIGNLGLPVIVGLLGAMEYYKRGHINIAASLWIALGLFIGAWFGAKLAQSISGQALQRSFAIFLVIVAIRVWWKA